MLQIQLPPEAQIAIGIIIILTVAVGIALYFILSFISRSKHVHKAAEKTVEAICCTRIGRFVLGICLLGLILYYPVQWDGGITPFTLHLIVLSVLFIVSGLGLKIQYVLILAGVYGVANGVYQIYYKTPLALNAAFILTFLWGGLGLTIIAIICLRGDKVRKDYDTSTDYPPW